MDSTGFQPPCLFKNIFYIVRPHNPDFFSGVLINILYAYIVFPLSAACPTNLILFSLPNNTCLKRHL